MDAEHQAFLLSHLENSKNVLENSIQDFDCERWFSEPGPARWSVGQCAEHIVTVELRVLGLVNSMANMPEESFDQSESEEKDILVQRVATRETRVQAPPALNPESKYKNAGDFLDAFRACHSKLLELAGHNPFWLRGRFVDHPILKKLDGFQWILAASSHTLRHAAQIEEVKEQLSAAQAG